MLATLDTETKREWELIKASRNDTTTTVELVTILESRCRALELLQTSQSLKSTAITQRSSQSTGGKVSKSTHTYVATQLKCPVCNASHRLFKYDRFIKMQPKQRLNCAKQLKPCFNCLQLFTKAHTWSKLLCRQCFTLIKRIIQQMTRGPPQTITILQMQRVQQLQRSTLTVH